MINIYDCHIFSFSFTFLPKNVFVVVLNSTLDNFSYLGKGKFHMVTLFQTDLSELFTNVMQTLVNVFYLLNSVHTIQDD